MNYQIAGFKDMINISDQLVANSKSKSPLRDRHGGTVLTDRFGAQTPSNRGLSPVSPIIAPRYKEKDTELTPIRHRKQLEAEYGGVKIANF